MEVNSSRRGGVLAIVLAVLAASIALVVLASVGVGMYMARHVRVEQSRGRTVVETPFGSLRLRQSAHFDPALFGVPVYPGAEQDDDHRKLASFDLELGDEGREFSVLAAQYTTSDPAGKVAAFYRERLPKWTVVQSVRRPWRHNETRFEWSGHGFRRLVAIHEEGGITRIALASMGDPAAN